MTTVYRIKECQRQKETHCKYLYACYKLSASVPKLSAVASLKLDRLNHGIQKKCCDMPNNNITPS